MPAPRMVLWDEWRIVLLNQRDMFTLPSHFSKNERKFKIADLSSPKRIYFYHHSRSNRVSKCQSRFTRLRSVYSKEIFGVNNFFIKVCSWLNFCAKHDMISQIELFFRVYNLMNRKYWVFMAWKLLTRKYNLVVQMQIFGWMVFWWKTNDVFSCIE